MEAAEKEALSRFHADVQALENNSVGMLSTWLSLMLTVTTIAELIVVISDASAINECNNIVWAAFLIDFVLGMLFANIFVLRMRAFTDLTVGVYVGITVGILIARFVPAVMVVSHFITASDTCRDELRHTHVNLYNVAMMLLFGYLAAPFILMIGHHNTIGAALVTLQTRFEALVTQHNVYVEEFRNDRGRIVHRYRIRSLHNSVA